MADGRESPEPSPEAARFFLVSGLGTTDFSPRMIYLATALGAYLLGSIPWGWIIGRIKGVDLRREGSGSTGATNALRVLGKPWGYTVFVLDALKGGLAVAGAFALARQTPGFEAHAVWLGVVAAISAVVGHSYPVWLGFQGGKGIATSAGVMIALFHPAVFLSGLGVWLILFKATRYVSVASLGAAVALPTSAAIVWALGDGDAPRTGIALAMCLVAVWRHRSNIARLLAGTEKRFEKKP